MTAIRRSWIAILAAILLIIGLLGWWKAIETSSGSAAGNHAVVNVKATDEVRTEVSAALTKVLSYDYSEPATTQRVADQVLEGKARKEYQTLFASLQKRAPGQKLVLTATVTAAGVKQLSGDNAKLLVFLDQSSRRAKDKEASVSAAQIAVIAKKTGGTWKVTSLKPL